jgi:DAACS family dicarboxylate/amino acid:cation (Na+ or H+) symporter
MIEAFMRKNRLSLPLHTKVLLALITGTLLGIACQQLFGPENATLLYVAKNIAQPLGKIYLNMILMVVVPLLFAAMALGISEIGDGHKMGRVGSRFVVVSLFFTVTAIFLSTLAVNVFGPGNSIDSADRQSIMSLLSSSPKAQDSTKATKGLSLSEWVDNIIPLNPVSAANNAATGGLLGFVFFSFIFGMALSKIGKQKAAPIRAFLEGVYAVCLKIIDMGIKLAPIGVFGLMFSVSALMGLKTFVALGSYVFLMLGVLATLFFLVCPLVLRFLAKRSPGAFFRQSKNVLMTAFATCSSSATLPLALQTAIDDMKLPRDVTTFVLTLGTSINRCASTAFQTATIFFLAQFYGISLSLADQIGIAALAYVYSLGVTGIPGGVWTPILFSITKLGLPLESIGICLGIDRVFDMARTTINTYVSLTTAASVASLTKQSELVEEISAIRGDLLEEAAVG